MTDRPTYPGSPCMVCGKPMVADNRLVPPDLDCCRCGTTDDLPARLELVGRSVGGACSVFLVIKDEPILYGSDLTDAAARIRELEAVLAAAVAFIEDDGSGEDFPAPIDVKYEALRSAVKEANR